MKIGKLFLMLILMGWIVIPGVLASDVSIGNVSPVSESGLRLPFGQLMLGEFVDLGNGFAAWVFTAISNAPANEPDKLPVTDKNLTETVLNNTTAAAAAENVTAPIVQKNNTVPELDPPGPALENSTDKTANVVYADNTVPELDTPGPVLTKSTNGTANVTNETANVTLVIKSVPEAAVNETAVDLAAKDKVNDPAPVVAETPQVVPIKESKKKVANNSPVVVKEVNGKATEVIGSIGCGGVSPDVATGCNVTANGIKDEFSSSGKAVSTYVIGQGRGVTPGAAATAAITAQGATSKFSGNSNHRGVTVGGQGGYSNSAGTTAASVMGAFST